MTDLHAQLKFEDLGDWPVFSREQLIALATEHLVVDEDGGASPTSTFGIVAVLVDDISVSFVVGEFHSQEVGDGKPVMISVIFYGNGFAGSLRECRHTHWGEGGNGYVFYPPGALIKAAIDYLGKWFDL